MEGLTFLPSQETMFPWFKLIDIMWVHCKQDQLFTMFSGEGYGQYFLEKWLSDFVGSSTAYGGVNFFAKPGNNSFMIQINWY